MSAPTSKPAVSGTVLIVGIAVVFCFAVAASVAVVWAVPDGGNPGSLMTIILAAAGTAIAAMVGLAKIHNVEQSVDRLSNGLSDAKIRKALEQVLLPHLVDPDARPLLQRDEVVIEAEERRQEAKYKR